MTVLTLLTLLTEDLKKYLSLTHSLTDNLKARDASASKNQWKGPNFQIRCFTMGRQELCAENAQKTPKLEKLKRKLLNVLKRYDLYGWYHGKGDVLRIPKML